MSTVIQLSKVDEKEEKSTIYIKTKDTLLNPIRIATEWDKDKVDRLAQSYYHSNKGIM